MMKGLRRILLALFLLSSLVFSIFPGSIVSAQNPLQTIVRTLNATRIASDSALISGNLTQKGLNFFVSASFVWDTNSHPSETGAYAFQTHSQRLRDTGIYSFQLDGLKPDTDYYFRARADGGIFGGIAFGDEMHFKTSAAVRTPTTTTLTTSNNPSLVGQSVTFTARVTGSRGNLTGTVDFKDGPTVIGRAVRLERDVARYNTSTLTAGSHSITATYSGDSGNEGSTSPPINQVVNAPVKPPTQYQLTVNISGTGTVTRSPDQDTFVSGTTVTLTANAAAGWAFGGWKDVDSSNGNIATVTMRDGNRVVTATFTLINTGGNIPIGNTGNDSNNNIGVGAVGSSDRTYFFQHMTGAPGQFTTEATANSVDNCLKVTITKGTIFRTAEGWAGSFISLKTPEADKLPSPPPKGYILGKVYELGLEGSTFSPPIALSLKYDQNSIPAGIEEKDLVIGYWDNNSKLWMKLANSTLDIEKNAITTAIDHFSSYAILAYQPANFYLGSLSVTPLESSPGQDIIIRVPLYNSGGSPGKYPVSCKLNAIQIESREVTVEAGQSTTLEFKIAGELPGKYNVEVNGSTGTFVVRAPAPTTSAVSPTPEIRIPAASVSVIPGPVKTQAPTPTVKTETPEPKTERTISPLWIIAGCVVLITLVVLLLISLTRRKG